MFSDYFFPQHYRNLHVANCGNVVETRQDEMTCVFLLRHDDVWFIVMTSKWVASNQPTIWVADTPGCLPEFKWLQFLGGKGKRSMNITSRDLIIKLRLHHNNMINDNIMNILHYVTLCHWISIYLLVEKRANYITSCLVL